MTNTRDRYCKQTLIGHWNLGEPHLGKVFGMTQSSVFSQSVIGPVKKKKKEKKKKFPLFKS